MDSYLSSKGYIAAPVDTMDVAPWEIISYGTSTSNIAHVARFAAGFYSNAKWGPLELLQHSGTNPYKSSSPPSDVYGDARKIYYKSIE
jgi:hypothetical protein